MLCPEYIIPIISGSPSDTNFDHLVKVMSARFLHYKVTNFTFVIHKYIGVGVERNYFEAI